MRGHPARRVMDMPTDPAAVSAQTPRILKDTAAGPRLAPPRPAAQAK